jgi:tetratricopeptide (TPR) repeat protein
MHTTPGAGNPVATLSRPSALMLDSSRPREVSLLREGSVALHPSRAPRPRAAADVLRSVFPFGLLLMMIYASAGLAAGTCTPPLARLTSAQGLIESQRDAGFRPAARNAEFCPGDVIRVGPRSRAGLRLSNETYIPLDQNTQIKLNGFDESGKASFIDLESGVIHIITRTPKPIRIRTPFMNAMVEGTEFFVAVSANDARVGVVEGKVRVTNDLGDLLLADNEAAITERGQAPRKDLTIKPRDAVQWALYYPPIVDPILFGQAAQDQASPFADAARLYREGRAAEAIANLESVPQAARKTPYHGTLAALLLSVGQVNEAQQAIERELADNPKNGLALGLQAIIAIAQNRKEEALKTAQAATEADPKSSPAHIALSYAQQANFKLEDALASVKKAIELAPNDALAHARRAELEMSLGDLDKALAAARRATELNPNIARTQTILGFANLTRIDTKAAKQAFEKSIELDQADPLPRLGLGLAKIREGELQTGREEIEIAASLDPENSLVRSYLGKAYYEEKRNVEAAKQFELAKERDPKDPTPYFYDAIRKQTENRPVEALQDLNKSIELNDDRAVYRSTLLLDEDRAARSVNRARAFGELGFERRGFVEAANSLSSDLANDSAHRFLSDAYAQLDRQEIGRVSELLQAQLLQPLSSDVLQPQRAFADLNLTQKSAFTDPTQNEYTALFERDQTHISVAGLVGNHNSIADEVVVAGVNRKFAYSVGQFHYETDGFRPNNDSSHDIYNGFAQWAVNSSVSLQAEFRQRQTKRGDLALTGDPNEFFPEDRTEVKQDVIRLGAHLSHERERHTLVSLFYGKLDSRLKFPDPLDLLTRDTGWQLELEHFWRIGSAQFVGGIGRYSVNVKFRDFFDGRPSFDGSCDPDVCSESFGGRDRSNAFVLGHLKLGKKTTWVLGASYDSLKDAYPEKINKLSPKIGLRVEPSDMLLFRFAAFQSVKPALIVNQTLEPTQIVGFSQFFDDSNGTISKRYAAGIDVNFAGHLYSGLELSRRELKDPHIKNGRLLFGEPVEQLAAVYVNWPISPNWSAGLEYHHRNFTVQEETAAAFGQPSNLLNEFVPFSIHYFARNRLSAGLTATFVSQSFDDPIADKKRVSSRFTVIDAICSYQLPRRLGQFKIEVRNVLDKKFSYRDLNFLTRQPLSPTFVPDRTVIGHFILTF